MSAIIAVLTALISVCAELSAGRWLTPPRGDLNLRMRGAVPVTFLVTRGSRALISVCAELSRRSYQALPGLGLNLRMRGAVTN